MFQFLQPIWLLGLTALAAPIAIYLWHPRPGKTLKVGSVKLIEDSKVAYHRQLQPLELLLFIIRCLLITSIAFALASPLWKKPLKDPQKGWILMPPDELPDTYRHFKPQVDSLLKAGFTLHYFYPGFKQFTLDDALQRPATNFYDSAGTSYRSTVALLNQQLDRTTPVYIFTDNFLRHFQGPRSAVDLNLHWQLDSTHIVKAGSPLNETPLNITVYASPAQQDANYVLAALDAIKQFSKKTISIHHAIRAEEIPVNQDWLFWLSDNKPPADMGTKNLFQYAIGTKTFRRSYVLPARQNKYTFEAIPLYFVSNNHDAPSPSEHICWQDGFGHPLLTFDSTERTNVYKLYTHFNPAWNQLVWDEAFPSIIYRLLYSAEETSSEKWLQIDSAQAMPVIRATDKPPGIASQSVDVKLSHLCWILALFLFVLERTVSFYYLKKQGNE